MSDRIPHIERPNPNEWAYPELAAYQCPSCTLVSGTPTKHHRAGNCHHCGTRLEEVLHENKTA